MPVLENPRHEIFARETAKGSSQREAYKAAGFEGDNDAAVDASASRLLCNAKVKLRIAEIQAAAAKRAEITVEKVLLELSKIAFADIRNVVRWSNQLRARNVDDAVGSVTAVARGDAPVSTDEVEVLESAVLLVPSAQLDDETAGAISEVSQGRNGLKIKMHDKRAALVDIGRHLGMFVDKVEHSGTVGLTPLTVVIDGSTPK